MKYILFTFLTAVFIITICDISSKSKKEFSKPYIIKMLDRGETNKNEYMVFEPTYLEVEKDSHIKFQLVNNGHGSRSISTPIGGEHWNSGLNKEITINLKNEGYYLYDCKPHSPMGMVGLIKVGTPNKENTTTTKKHLEELLKTSSMNKDRIIGLINKL